MQRRIVWTSPTEFSIDPPVDDPLEAMRLSLEWPELREAQALWAARVYPNGAPRAVTLSDPPDEAGHYGICPACGQAFDRRELGQVAHHMAPKHQRLPLSA